MNIWLIQEAIKIIEEALGEGTLTEGEAQGNIKELRICD